MNQDNFEEHRRRMQVGMGEAIRARRCALGLGQRQLAARVGTHRPLVARVERGTHELMVGTVMRYAAALGWTTAQLVEEAERRGGAVLPVDAGEPSRQLGLWQCGACVAEPSKVTSAHAN